MIRCKAPIRPWITVRKKVGSGLADCVGLHEVFKLMEFNIYARVHLYAISRAAGYVSPLLIGMRHDEMSVMTCLMWRTLHRAG